MSLPHRKHGVDRTWFNFSLTIFLYLNTIKIGWQNSNYYIILRGGCNVFASYHCPLVAHERFYAFNLGILGYGNFKSCDLNDHNFCITASWKDLARPLHAQKAIERCPCFQNDIWRHKQVYSDFLSAQDHACHRLSLEPVRRSIFFCPPRHFRALSTPPIVLFASPPHGGHELACRLQQPPTLAKINIR